MLPIKHAIRINRHISKSLKHDSPPPPIRVHRKYFDGILRFALLYIGNESIRFCQFIWFSVNSEIISVYINTQKSSIEKLKTVSVYTNHVVENY